MLQMSKKIKKTSNKPLFSTEDILKCHLFPSLPQQIFELCYKKKSLKNFLTPKISQLLLEASNIDLLIMDDFRCEFHHLLKFISDDEEILTPLEKQFKIFLMAVAKGFPLHKEVFQFIALTVGVLLTEKEKKENQNLKKKLDDILNTSVKFAKLRRILSDLEKPFLESLLKTLSEWRAFFQD